MVSSSTSTKTSVAPSRLTTSADEKKVKSGTKTASPGPIPPYLEGKGESIGAVGTTDAMLHTDIFGQLGFKFLDGLAHDKGTRLHHVENGLVYLGFQYLVLML